MPTLLEVAADLYARVPGEMVAARDARVRELRDVGDESLARRVKALRKPSAAAWVVNHLARTDPDQVEQVVELGATFRAAQADLDGPRLRELTRQRRALVAAVATRARDLAAERGVAVSDAVAAQIEATLTAAMIDDDAGRAVRSGVLVGALQATGVGRAEVASAVAVPDELGIAPSDGPDDEPASRARHLHAVPDPPSPSRASSESGAKKRDKTRRDVERRRAAAREALDDAEDDVAAAEEAQRAATAETERLGAAARRVDAERDALKERLAEIDGQVRAVESELRGADRARSRAERTLADAVRRRDEATERLAGLEPEQV